MAVYLPYIRSVSDSLFISYENLSKGTVLLDDIQIELLKMQEREHHDWILPADDPVDTACLYHTDLETSPAAPWGNLESILTQHSYSGKKASCIQLSSPYSVVFEKDLDTSNKSDGYYRIDSRIKGDEQAEVLLVFDFSSNGKSVFYKTYPVTLGRSKAQWTSFEVFREFPLTRLKAQKVKIYYWYLKGTNPVYVDDLQVDVVKYKPARLTKQPSFPGNMNSETLNTACCDFEKVCRPESGYTIEVADACSGTKVCMINTSQPFSFSHLMPLATMPVNAESFVYITAKVKSDQYKTGATLVTDFRHNGKSVSYHPAYMRGQTIKGQWNTIGCGITVPHGITAKDSVLVYFYLANTDEELLIDDFCVSLKKPKAKPSGKNK